MPDIIRFLHSRKSSNAAILWIAALGFFAHEGAPSISGAEQRQVSVAITPLSGGYVNGGGSFLDGSQVTLSAAPATGYSFTGWGGDASGVTNPLILTADQNYTVTASFAFNSADGFPVSAVPNPVGTGFVSGAGNFTTGEQVALTATAADGFVFAGWSGDASGAENPLEIDVDKALNITANFNLVTGQGHGLTVSASPSGAGHVVGGGSYQEGSDALLTASAGNGFKFSGWSGDASGTDNPLTVTVSQSLNITAEFVYDEPPHFNVDVDVDPDGHGFAHGGGIFIDGAEATLTATPSARYLFSGWSGDVTSTDNPLKVAVEKDMNITANYVYDVGDRFVRVGEGKFDMGNASKTTGAEGPAHEVHLDSFYIDKFEITRGIWLQVMNWGQSNGYTFDYTGGNTGSNGQIPPAASDDHPVIVNWYDAVKWCNARSEMESRPPVYYTDAGNNQVYRSGVLDLTDSMVDWSALGYRLPTEAEWEKAARGGLAGKSYPNGDTLDDTLAYFDKTLGDTTTVGQYPANGYGIYDMAGNVWEACWDWYGKEYYSENAASQDNPRGPSIGNYRVVRGGAGDSSSSQSRVNYRKDFNKTWIQYAIGFRCAIPEPPKDPYKTLQIVANPSTHGTVEGSGRYIPDSTATVTVTPSTGAKFTGWGSDGTGTNSSVTITMDADKTVTAAFEDDPSYPYQTLAVSANPAGYGVVSGGGTYDPGAQVTLTATPVTGAKFKGWGGDGAGSTNPLTITLDADKTISAEFEPDTSAVSHILSITATPANFGTVSGAGTYAAGSIVQLTANPETGAVFTGWSGDATGADNPLSVTMDAAKSITATFSQDPAAAAYTVSANVDPAGLGSVSGAGIYKSGSTATLRVTLDTGVLFLGWKGDATGTDNPLVLTVDGNKNITAEFEKELPDEVTVQIPEGSPDITTLDAPKSATTPKFEAVGGVDATLFVLDVDTGELSFNFTPDFESPQDSGNDNTYDFKIQIKDAATDELKATQDIHVEVTDVAESPTITSNGGGETTAVTIEENTTAIATFVASDPDGDDVSFSLSGGPDLALFNIDAGTGVLALKAAADFETALDSDANNSYVVEVSATDDSADNLTDKQTFTITVTDLNEVPVITSNGGADSATVNVQEGDSAVTTVTALDQEDNALSYTITGGADKDLLVLNPSSGELAFIEAKDFEAAGDADANNSYIVEVTVTDDGDGNLTDKQTITINLTDKPELPTITSNGGGETPAVSIEENTTAIATVVATDPDGDDLSFSLSGGPDQALFNIDAGTGVLALKVVADFETALDSDANNSYVVEVTATDDSADNLTDKQTFTITVTDVNEAPVINSNDGGDSVTLNVQEGDSAVTTVTALDQEDNTLSFTITGGADKDLFVLNPTSGELAFIEAKDFEAAGDADANNSYIVDVTVTDDGDGSLTDKQTITINLTDKPEAPSITSNGGGDSATIDITENITDVTTVTATDPDDDGLAFTITGGTDKDLFDLNPAFGVLTFKSAPDFEAPADGDGDNSYIVEVTVTDDGSGNLTDVQTLTIKVGNVNEPPLITSNGGGATSTVSIAEGTVAVTTVTGTDPEDDQVTFSISGGADAALFSMDASGALVFKTAPDFADPKDADSNNTYIVELIATDDGEGNLTSVQNLTITVTNILQDPVITSDGGGDTASLEIDENISVVTTVVATDPDGGGLDYTLSGGKDASLFNLDIATGVLTFKDSPNFERPLDDGGDNVYEVIVSASSKGMINFLGSNFDSGVDGFTYMDDLLGTSQPTLADGNHDASGGFSGGGLYTYFVGGGGQSRSGGWSREITLAQAGALQVSLRFRLTMAAGFESDEWGAAWLKVNDTLHGNAQNNHLVRLVGTGDVDTGWLSETFNISLPAGTHTLQFGAYNNKSTTGTEITRAWFDDLSIQLSTGDTQALTVTVKDLKETPDDIFFPTAPFPEGQPVGTIVGSFFASDGDGIGGYDPSANLVAHYQFEDNASGTSVVDSTGNHPATLMSGAVITPLGHSGQGMTLPTSHSAARLQIGTAGLNLDGDWTGSVWFKKLYANNSGWRTLFRGQGGNHVPIIESNGVALGFYDNAGGRGFVSTGFSMPSNDYQEWHHIAVAATNGKTHYYIDGNEVGSVDVVSGTDISIVGNYNSGQRFAEFIDDVRIFDRALDSGEINALYVTGSLDVGTGETHTFNLVSGEGDADNASFSIEDGKLKSGEVFRHGEKDQYSIRVKVTDKDGLVFEKAITVSIKAMPPLITSYQDEDVVYGRGFPITDNVPTVTGGVPTNFSITPALYTGLSLDPSTGVISGTPAQVYDRRSYTITVTGPGGATTHRVYITSEERVPQFHDPGYDNHPLVLAEGIPIYQSYPKFFGYSRDFTIDPALPTGLNIDGREGYIRGTPPSRTLIARSFWSFNEGNLRETSIENRDNDGYSSGDPAFSSETAGDKDLAVELDGDDAIQIREPFTFLTTDQWTVSFWAIRPGNTFQGMAMGDRTDDNDYIWLSNSPTYGFAFRNTQGQSAYWTDATLRGGFTEWHHYMLAADGEGSLNLYRDGIHFGSKTVDTTFELNTIGNAFASQNLAFKGRIDDVSVWLSELGEEEARRLHNSGIPEDISHGLALDPLIYAGKVTAKNSAGEATYDLSLKVVPQPRVVKFEADSYSFPYGQSGEVTLSWEVLHAEKVILAGQEVPAKGTMKVTPDAGTPTDYTIFAAVGADGNMDGIVELGPVYHVGPFASNNSFNEAKGPEGNAINLDDTFDEDGGQIGWQKLAGYQDGVRQDFDTIDNSINYIFRELTAEKARELRLVLGHDDGIRIWVNGVEQYSYNSYGATNPIINLDEGENELLVKVSNGSGPTNLTFNPQMVSSGYSISQSLTLSPYNLVETEIGGATVVGSLDHDPSTGSYTLSSKGQSISYSGERFFFSSSRLVGDGEVTVRVASLDSASTSALAGLNFRPSLSRFDASASILLRNNDRAEYRIIPNYRAGQAYIHAETGIKAPYFLRMVRVADDFAGFISQDGNGWSEVARWTSIMPHSIDVGLAVASGDGNVNATANFDTFKIKQYNAHNLKGLWRFSSVQDNIALDSSTYGQSGSITDATALTDADRGPVLSFNGGSMVDPRSGITEFGTSDYTLSGWFKTSEAGTSILGKLPELGNWSQGSKQFIITSDDITATLKPEGSVNLVTSDGHINGGQSIIDSKWHHVAVTWDAQALQGRVYVDGVDATGVNPGNFNARADIRGSHSIIGKDATGSSLATMGYVGLMDDLALFGRVLNPTEILSVRDGDFQAFGIIDTTPPVITLLGSSDQTIDVGADWSAPGFQAVDLEQGNMNTLVQVTGDSVDPSRAGTYNILYNVTDASGNQATEVVRIVEVSSEPDNKPPVVTLEENVVSPLVVRTKEGKGPRLPIPHPFVLHWCCHSGPQPGSDRLCRFLHGAPTPRRVLNDDELAIGTL